MVRERCVVGDRDEDGYVQVVRACREDECKKIDESDL